jgi:two-component system sensor histidine kinase RegB
VTKRHLHPSRAAIALPWLVRLRWHAVVGQALAIAVASRGLGAHLPEGALVASVALLALSNGVLAARARWTVAAGAGTLGATLLFDAAQLTMQLSLSGGPSNPFAVLYLVEILVAVLVLDARWIAAVSLTCMAGFSWLFLSPHPVELSATAQRAGTWAALAVAIGILAFLGGRLAARLREQEAALARSQRLAGRAERLASLSTLAAGAAHELGTPLGTIAIASSELERLVVDDPEEALEAARVVRDEVERCREILGRMSGRAGAMVGELPEDISAAAVVAIARHELPESDRARVHVEGDLDHVVQCPVQSLAQVLAGLLANALHASREGDGVVVRVRADAGARTIRFDVIDDGHGIPPYLVARLGEPFFTTKPPGKGMGLGLFLAQSFAELCRGALEIDSVEHEGTRVSLTLPLAAGGRA